MITLNDMMVLLLDNACPMQEFEDGTKLFYISTHCVDWYVTAYKRNGVWEVISQMSEDT